MGNYSEEDFAVDGEGAPGGKGAAEVALDHGEDGFYLPPLAVGLFGEALVQPPAVVSFDRVWTSVEPGAAPRGRGDDACHVELFAAVDVRGLALVAGVGQERLEAVARQTLVDCALELRVVELGPAVHDRREYQVARGVAERGKLGIAVLEVPRVTSASAGVVDRNAAALEARGV